MLPLATLLNLESSSSLLKVVTLLKCNDASDWSKTKNSGGKYEICCVHQISPKQTQVLKNSIFLLFETADFSMDFSDKQATAEGQHSKVAYLAR